MIPRRIFLKNGGLALLSLGFAPAFLARTSAAAGSTGTRVLITIFQRGAVDGLNMIVPFGERDYYAARPSLALARPGADPDAAVDLDGFFGLHPRMSPLTPLYDARQLAIVHACGSPDGTRSHFDAQDYMESATPGVKSTRDGWLNRCLHAREHQSATPFRAVALAPQLPRALQGIEPALAIGQIGQFGIRAGLASDMVQSSFEAEYAEAAAGVLNATGREAFDAVKMLKTANPQRYAPEHGADYPRSPFGDALKQIAQLIKAGVGLEIAFAESGNWDHHVNEGAANGILAGRLDDLARGIAALALDLGDRMQDVVILTMSEFGRAVTENGNRGTDHGHANAMMILGGGIRGGKVYGRWPGLAPEQRYEGRDLAVTTDFRSVFSEVVRNHLGLTDTRTVFPGFTAPSPLGLFTPV
ncbi:MAG: hypothetical protein A3H96_10650 [Acidobacteria bacterium RIFCSPLOWO2_02_FULL_67_36]|nr:MAG: hypothetical protein A3H96_10650 [Acidobacteria bacterium RIFCSPLOWO2_02_FULL_67_36]OFW24603.1 MAG: hypothetical protein A3G21_17520 [Acidobacteria bacterium RIFCSPLOWO2_12_FULL_66_21]